MNRRRVLFGALATVVGWSAGPALAETARGWIKAGINVSDYVFNTGEDPRRPMSRYNRDQAGMRQDYLQFPPVEGLGAVSIRAKPGARPGGMGTLARSTPARIYRGKRVRLSANLRTEKAGRAQLWMRIDGPGGRVLAIDDMQSRPLRGTTRWRRYSIVLAVPAEATDISWGFLLAGSGAVWANDFSLNPVSNSTPVTGGAGGAVPE